MQTKKPAQDAGSLVVEYEIVRRVCETVRAVLVAATQRWK
jgi:hypothetical protein